MTKAPIITNRKPADELAWLREQMKDLSAREDYIKRMIVSGEMSSEGDEHFVEVVTQEQNRFQRKLVEEELGDLDRFFKKVEMTICRVKPKPSAEE